MPDSRRPKHPHAVSSFTRKERANKNMHPEPHYALPDNFESQKRKYKGSLKRVAKGGRTRRGRKSRSTRRR
jgi:hypothetical protein